MTETILRVLTVPLIWLGYLLVAVAVVFAFIGLRKGINHLVDSITALFGKGPRAKKPPATDA
jgi:hypothetical protein